MYATGDNGIMTGMSEQQAETAELIPTAITIRGQDGRFMPGSRTPKPITPTNAYEYHELQRRKRVDMAISGIQRATGVTNKRESLHIMAEAQARVALDPKSRNNVQAYRTLMQQLDLLPERNTAQQDGASARITLDVPGDVLVALMDRLHELQGE